MNFHAVYFSVLVYLEFVLVTVDGHKYNKGITKQQHYPLEDKPTPPVRLFIYNCLNVPMNVVRTEFHGNVILFLMKQGSINPSSRGQVNVHALRPHQEIYGFIHLNATEKGHDIPISLYFSIPNEYSRRLPWYGIDMYSSNYHAIMDQARNLQNVSQLSSAYKNFSYPTEFGTISLANTDGLTLTAGMYRDREPRRQLDQVVVKFIVHHRTSMHTASTAFTHRFSNAVKSHRICAPLRTTMAPITPTNQSAITASNTITSTTTPTAPSTTAFSTPTTLATTIPSSKPKTTPTTTTIPSSDPKTTTPTTTTTFPSSDPKTITPTTTTIPSSDPKTTTPRTTTIPSKPKTTTTISSTTAIPSATTIPATTPTTTSPSATPTTTASATTPSTATASITPTITIIYTAPATMTASISEGTTTTTDSMLTAIVDDYEYYGETVPW